MTLNSNQGEFGLFGAFERHNFGDWLMAYCASELLKPEQRAQWIYDFENFGEGINADCGNFVQLKQFVTNSISPTIIHVGGETLACSSLYAAKMASQDLPIDHARPLHYVLPPVISGKHLQRTFFGTGGAGVSELHKLDSNWLQDVLSSASWVSVRDVISFQGLQSLGIEPILHPDIVSVISKFQNRNTFHLGESRKLVFQINKSSLEIRLQETCDTFFRYFNEYDSIKLVIAGVAPDHDSIKTYLELAHLVNKKRKNWISILFDLNPLKIVEEIATAKLVIATSLHFRIVAMSYGIPRISMFVPKAIDYGENWDLATFGINDYRQFPEKLAELGNHKSSEFEDLGESMGNEVLINWGEMMSRVDK